MKKWMRVWVAAAVAAAMLTGSALAWYTSVRRVELGQISSSVSAVAGYFAGGDGRSESTAFEIATAEQLQKMAWLQYLGYFNDDHGTVTYFKLTDSVNMNNAVLPPIGTRTNPFLGHFDGNGQTISNLVISNAVGSGEIPTDSLPTQVTKTESSQVSNVEIVGLFGVVGPMTGSAKTDNGVKDLTIENITVRTQTSETLVGLAAGYVNAPLSGVSVENSSIEIAGTNPSRYVGGGDTATDSTVLSDYALVGYATEDYVGEEYFDTTLQFDGSFPFPMPNETTPVTVSGKSLYLSILHYQETTPSKPPYPKGVDFGPDGSANASGTIALKGTGSVRFTRTRDAIEGSTSGSTTQTVGYVAAGVTVNDISANDVTTEKTIGVKLVNVMSGTKQFAYRYTFPVGESVVDPTAKYTEDSDGMGMYLLEYTGELAIVENDNTMVDTTSVAAIYQKNGDTIKQLWPTDGDVTMPNEETFTAFYTPATSAP